ncbi:MAG: F0F1 ATP synthase subunit B [Bacteroidota bacterium]
MELIKPDIGLIFWMALSFLIVLFLLKKFAWKPILCAIKEREDSIEDALNKAEKAREKIATLKVQNIELINQAKEEREKILKEARGIKNVILAEAKDKAKEETEKALRLAREAINNEKKAAIAEIKDKVAGLSIQIAEKILKAELSEENKNKEFINNLLKEIKLN